MLLALCLNLSRFCTLKVDLGLEESRDLFVPLPHVTTVSKSPVSASHYYLFP